MWVSGLNRQQAVVTFWPGSHTHVCVYYMCVGVRCNWLMQDVHKLVKNIFALANLVMVVQRELHVAGAARVGFVGCF